MEFQVFTFFSNRIFLNTFCLFTKMYMVPTSKIVTFFPILELCVRSKLDTYLFPRSQIISLLQWEAINVFFCSQILYKKFIDFYYIAFFYIFSIKASLELHFGWNSSSLYGDASTNIFSNKNNNLQKNIVCSH